MRFRGLVSDAARPLLPLAPGERVLASGRTTAGAAVIATTHALQRQAEHGEAVATPYVEILSARWLPDTATLELVEAGAGASRRVRLAFTEPGLLPETVRERVQRSILATRRMPVHGSRAVTVVARRAPAGEGELTWQVSLDAGLDESDPAVIERVDAAMAELRAELGA